MSVFISDNFVIKYRYNMYIHPTFLFIKKSLHNLCIWIWGKRYGEKVWKLYIEGKFLLNETEFEILMLL